MRSMISIRFVPQVAKPLKMILAIGYNSILPYLCLELRQGVSCLAHHLLDVLRRPPYLSKGQTSLDALEELPRDLVSHNVPSLTIM